MAAHDDPDYSFWQEEQSKRLAVEDHLARREAQIPVTDLRQQFGHLPSFEEKHNEWSDLIGPILEAIGRIEGLDDEEDESSILGQLQKIRMALINSHQEAIRYRTKGRVWRGLRNRSEQYILEFRRATQYYFANQSDQTMEPANFRTAVADFHAALSTTLKGLRVAMGQEVSEAEVLDAEYDSDGGEPIVNLRINHSTPQPFSDLVQGIVEMSDIIRQRQLGAADAGSKAALENVKYYAEKLREKEEEVERLERENQDFHNARGPPPSNQYCAKEKAEIDRLKNELKRAQDAEAETRKQFELANNYIDGVSRGRRVPSLPDEVGGVYLTGAIFDELCQHFELYHDNSEGSLARVKAAESSLRNAVLNPSLGSNKALEQKFQNQLAQADAAVKAKDAIIRNLRVQLKQGTKDLQEYRANSDRLLSQVTDLTNQLDNSVKNLDLLQNMEAESKRAGARISSEAYKELEVERTRLLQINEDLDSELLILKENLNENQRKTAEKDREIRRLEITLAWDQDASRNRQEIQDLRERIIAYEHAIEECLTSHALEKLGGSGALDPDLRAKAAKYQKEGPPNQTITNLRREIANLEKTISSLQAELEEAKAALLEDIDAALALAYANIDERDHKVADLHGQIAANTAIYEQKVTDIQGRLDEARLNANGISPEDLRDVRRDLANCRIQQHEDQETIARLQGDLTAGHQRGELKDRRIRKFAEKNVAAPSDQLQKLQEAMQEEIDKLEAKLQQERKEREELAGKARGKAEVELQRVLEQSEADRTRRDESFTSFDTNEEVNKEHIARLRAQGAQMRAMQADIDQLQLDTASSRAQLFGMTKERDSLVARVRKLREEGGENMNTDQLQNVQNLEAEIAELQTRLEACEQTGATLQLQRDHAIAQNNETTALMAELQIAHDTMAGEGPKLGMRRIKTRIANQAKATKARNIAAREAEEAKRSAAARTQPQPPPTPLLRPPSGGRGPIPESGPPGENAGVGGGGRGTGRGRGSGGGSGGEARGRGRGAGVRGRVTRSRAKKLAENEEMTAEEKGAADQEKKDDAAAKKAAADKKKADDAARQKMAAEELKRKFDAIAKKNKEEEEKKDEEDEEEEEEEEEEEGEEEEEEEGEGEGGQERGRDNDDNQPGAGAAGGGGAGRAGTKRPGGDVTEPPSKKSKSGTAGEPIGGKMKSGARTSKRVADPSYRPPKTSDLTPEELELEPKIDARAGEAPSVPVKKAPVKKAPVKKAPVKKAPPPPAKKTTRPQKKKAVNYFESESPSPVLKKGDENWEQSEEEEDEPLTSGGEDEDADNALEEIIEAVPARAPLTSEGPQRSSFVTHKPATRPKVTFDTQAYVLEPEQEDLTTPEVKRGVKRAAPTPPARPKRPRR